MQHPVAIRAEALQIPSNASMLSLHVGNMHSMVVDFDARWSGFRPVFFDRIKATIFTIQAAMFCNKFGPLQLRKAGLSLAFEVRDNSGITLDPASLLVGGRKFIQLCLSCGCTSAWPRCSSRFWDYPETSRL